MALKKLSLIKGNTQTYTVVFKDADDHPYCIKNWVVYFTLKTNHVVPDSEASLQKIITTFSDTTSGTTGIATISLVPEDTENLEPAIYDFDIKVTTAASESFTVMKGKFDLEYNVTVSTGTAGTAA